MVDIGSYRNLKEEIKAGDIKPVYLFSGEEACLKRFAMESVKSAVLKPDAVSCNYNLFYSNDAELGAIFDAVNTQPFLTERRLVVIKNIEKFSSQEEPFLGLLNRVNTKTVIILETDKLLSDKFIKKLVPLSAAYVFYPLEGADLQQWIGSYVKSKGGKISPNAAALLVEKVGNELDTLVNALNKVCLYVSEGKIISEEDIDSLVKKTREDTRFMFLDALMGKRVPEALQMVNELSRDGKQAADIIGLINWQLRRIERFKEMSDAGYSRADIAQEFKTSARVLGIIDRQSARFSRKDLEKGFEFLLESDLAIKQGRQNAALALELIVVRLCASL